MKYRIPIGKCPCCKHSIVYSDNPKNKNKVIIRIADDNYSGNTILCAKCKTMLSIIEEPIVAERYVAIPVVNIL